MPNSESITPFLMFEGTATDAIEFYLRTFRDARLLAIEKYGPEGPGPEGTVVTAHFVLNGQQFMASDSHVKHAFTFTPSLSLFVNCRDEAELEQLFGTLSEGGGVLMPLDNYGFSRRFAWVNDRFGVSWQLNLP